MRRKVTIKGLVSGWDAKQFVPMEFSPWSPLTVRRESRRPEKRPSGYWDVTLNLQLVNVVACPPELHDLLARGSDLRITFDAEVKER